MCSFYSRSLLGTYLIPSLWDVSLSIYFFTFIQFNVDHFIPFILASPSLWDVPLSISFFLLLYVSSFLFSMGQRRPLFRLFLVFSNKHYNFYNKSMWKMSIQYTVPGFEPTTLEHESSPITTRPGLPPRIYLSFLWSFCLFLLLLCYVPLFQSRHTKAS